MIIEVDGDRLMTVLRLALNAARSACDHPAQIHEYGAKRGCGGCRAVVVVKGFMDEVKQMQKPQRRLWEENEVYKSIVQTKRQKKNQKRRN